MRDFNREGTESREHPNAPGIANYVPHENADGQRQGGYCPSRCRIRDAQSARSRAQIQASQGRKAPENKGDGSCLKGAVGHVPSRKVGMTHSTVFQCAKRVKLTLRCSRITYFFYEPHILSPPSIPDPYSEGVDYGGNQDILGQAVGDPSESVPLVPGIATAECRLSELLYEMMQYINTKTEFTGSDEDLSIRKIFYGRLVQFRQGLLRQFQVEHNFTPSTCFLRYGP